MSEADRVRGCRPLTPDETSAVLGALDGPSKLLALVCLHMGLRLQEALNLNVGDVATWETDRWRPRPQVLVRRATTKGKDAGRTIAVHEELRAAIGAQLAQLKADRKVDASRPLFEGRAGRLTRTAAWRPFRRVFDALDNPTGTGTHSFRKTFATRLLDAGVNLVRIQQLLGHADPRETIRYLAIERSTLDEAVLGLPSFVPTPNGAPS